MQKKSNKSSLKYQLQSFRWAAQGLSEFFKSEVKARIHTSVAIIAICMGIWLKVSSPEWLFIMVAICMVFITEIINSALERIADTLDDKHDLTRMRIKDFGAGAVLIASITAVILGCIIFLPKLFHLIQGVIV